MRRLRSETFSAAHRTFIVVCHVLLFALAALYVEPQAHAADNPIRRAGAILLDAAQLDRVTAGVFLAQIDASATAHGTTNAFTEASATLQSMRGSVLMVQVNPAASPTPLGNRAVDVTYGTGNATAIGDQNADCSVTATILATDVVAAMVAATKQTTLTTSICQCSLWAVSLVK